MRRALLGLLAAALLAGCGSAPADEWPPAARAGSAPPLAEPPAGRVVRLGGEPAGVVADPLTGLVAVALRPSGRVGLHDGETGALRRRLDLGASALALEGPGGAVLAATAAGRTGLTRVALPSGEPATSAPRLARAATALAAARGRVFATDARAGTLTAIDAATGRVLALARTALEPRDVAPLARSRAVAVLSVRERVLELFDARTLRRLGRVPAGIGPARLATDGKDRLYVTDTVGDALLVYHRLPRLEPTRRYALPGGPYAIAADRVRGRLWVTLARRNELVELRAGARPGRLRAAPSVRQAEGVAVDPGTGRVAVTGRAPGVLQLVDPQALPTPPPR